MRFLLDTNILIPAEPTSTTDVEATTPVVTRLIGLLAGAKFSTFIHPSSATELLGDRDSSRRDLRQQLLSKYETLPSPPSVTEALHQQLGAPQPGTNNAVDNELIAAVERNAVNYLVTNDDRIHKKLVRLDLGHRGLYPSDAIGLVRGLAPQEISPPPAVRKGLCHELNREDTIFDTLRTDYDGFDSWLEKCQLNHREVFIVDSNDGVAGIAIIKDESEEHPDRVLKICCFKVAETSRGFKFGELLLKSVFDYCIAHGFTRTYCTCFPKWTQLLGMLTDFGFYTSPQDGSDELIVEKRFAPIENANSISPLDFHVNFGPALIQPTNEIFVVPIEPRYHQMLFPDMEEQQSFFAGETPFGNSIRKAYLCHSPSKSLTPGSILLFYRSDDYRNIQTVGVTESWVRSNNPTEIIEFVGQRTVYSKSAIEEMVKSEILAILFRYATVNVRITYDDLIENGCLVGRPQSITKIKPDGVEWIQHQLGM